MIEIYKSAQLFKVLGDITRIKIVMAIFETEKSVTAIAKEVNLTHSAVSHQLKMLKDSEIVRYKRRGKEMLYSLSDDHIKTIVNQVLTHVKNCEEPI